MSIILETFISNIFKCKKNTRFMSLKQVKRIISLRINTTQNALISDHLCNKKKMYNELICYDIFWLWSLFFDIKINDTNENVLLFIDFSPILNFSFLYLWVNYLKILIFAHYCIFFFLNRSYFIHIFHSFFNSIRRQ